MKIILSLLLLIVATVQSYGQMTASAALPSSAEIPMFPIAVTINKTTNIIFPYTIRNVDRGTSSLLVQKVDGAPHILQLKAAAGDMPETNLSVVTADMQLYSFVIRFDSAPHALNYDFKSGAFGSPHYTDGALFLNHEKLNDAQIVASAKAVAAQKAYLHTIKDSKEGVALKVNGIHINKDVMFLSLQLENGTAIAYDIESIQLFIRDQTRGKRTAIQEIPVDRRLVWGDSTMIESHTGQRLVLAFPKFTIPDQKECVLQLRESNGGRHLECKISNKQLMRSKELE